MRSKLQTDLQRFQAEQVILEQDKKNPHYGNTFTSLFQVQKQILETIDKLKLGIEYFTRSGHDELGSYIEIVVKHQECDDQIRNRIPLVLKDTNNPQAIGSAITYARRYGLCLTFGLCDQECDDDGNASAGKPKPAVASGKTFNMRGK
jgi:hypothetical protein